MKTTNNMSISIGTVLYSEEYGMFGKLIEKNQPQEAVLDLIDVPEEDLIYCNINKCRIPSLGELIDYTGEIHCLK